MEFLAPILSLVVGFFNFVLVLRTWLQVCHVSPHIPLSQTLKRLTDPLVLPVGKFIPTIKNINIAALLIAFLLTSLMFILLGTDIPTATLIGILSLIKTFGQILFFTTLIRALMSWVTQGNHPLDNVLVQLTEPVLAIIRRLLPRTGMLDFSVMVLGFCLVLLNNMMYSIFAILWALA